MVHALTHQTLSKGSPAFVWGCFFVFGRKNPQNVLMSPRIQIQPLNEHALTVSPAFAAESDVAERNAVIHQLSGQIESLALPGLVDNVPSFEKLALFFTDIPARMEAQSVLKSCEFASRTKSIDTRLHEIPVIYDGVDLPGIADHLSVSIAEVVAMHTGVEYVVGMIGFLPGFPYLLGMDSRLAMPRLATPRANVPKGSVAIGGAQTGIYPNASPGGWRLLGVTDVDLFDVTREEPSLLRAGDRVRFVVRGP